MNLPTVTLTGNFRPGLAHKMGIDSATLAQRFPAAGQFRVLTPPVKLEGEGFQAQGVTAPFATETRSLLLELGFSSDQIDELISHDVTRERERE